MQEGEAATDISLLERPAPAGAETEGWKRAHRKTDLLRHKTLEAVVVAVEVTTV